MPSAIIKEYTDQREALSQRNPVKCRFFYHGEPLVKFLLEGYNPLLVALMIGSGAIIIWPLIARMLSGGREIGTLEATRLMNRNALVLDVRDAAQFSAGHIPNAKHIPLAELDQRVEELAKFKTKPVIVSGADSSIITGKAMRVLMKNQFTDVYQLKGGVIAWQQASLPMER